MALTELTFTLQGYDYICVFEENIPREEIRTAKIKAFKFAKSYSTAYYWEKLCEILSVKYPIHVEPITKRYIV